MVAQVKILAKIINDQGILTDYYLEDQTGLRKAYTPQVVLNAIKTKKLQIINAKLAGTGLPLSDGRRDFIYNTIKYQIEHL